MMTFIPLVKMTALLLAISFSIMAKSQNSALINGTLQGNELWRDSIFLLEINSLDDLFNGSESLIVDTAIIDKSGNFHFNENKLTEIQKIYRLSIIPKNEDNGGAIIKMGKYTNHIFLILSKNSRLCIKMNASNPLASLEIQGDQENKSIRELMNLLQGRRNFEDYISEIVSSIQDSTQEFKDSTVVSLRNQYKGVLLKDQKVIEQFIDIVSNPWVAIIAAYYHGFLDLFEISKDYYTTLAQKLNQNTSDTYSLEFSEIIQKNKNTPLVNKKAPDISAYTPNGDDFSLYDMEGEVIILDFWASWCKPCRIENRTTIKLLNEKYQGKGLKIISISMDTNKEKWLGAVKEDNLIWLNASDLKGVAKSPIAHSYNIESIPQTVVLNSNKIILAQSLAGEALIKFVEKLLQKK